MDNMMSCVWTHADGKVIRMLIDAKHVGSYMSMNHYMLLIAITKAYPFGKPAFVLKINADGSLTHAEASSSFHNGIDCHQGQPA